MPSPRQSKLRILVPVLLVGLILLGVFSLLPGSLLIEAVGSGPDLVPTSPVSGDPAATPTPATDSSGDDGPHSTAHLPPPPDGYHWVRNETLSDEFNGSRLDSRKWQPRHPYWSGRDPSRFDPENVSVRDGMLRLKSTTDLKSLAEVEDPEKDIWVRAACVTSRQRSAHHGFYECRFQASRLSMTSSFWFQGAGCEIDVVEQIGAPAKNPQQARQMLMNTHLFTRVNGKKHDQATPKHWKMPTGAADQFHTYGVWWHDEHHASFYHDGRQVADIKFAGPFRKPMYLFLDTEVFTWAGLPSIESLRDPARNTMLVDWIRAWKLVPVQ